MITNDKGIVELKHLILREVCRLAWEDNLTQESCEKLVQKIIPGPKPEYRCCIYKEREIVRGRIRLAMGLAPDVNSDSGNVVAVIPLPVTTVRSRNTWLRISAGSVLAKPA